MSQEKTLTQLSLEDWVEKPVVRQPQKPKPRRPGSMAALVEGQECVLIPLTKGMWAIVDKGDADSISRHNWTASAGDKSGRLWYAVKFRHVKMHRWILGVSDPSIEVDHKNGNGLDNRRSNLRLATHLQNTRNKAVLSHSSTGIKGVTPHPSGWRARIKINGKDKHLGIFTTKEDARAAYKNAADAIYGDFSYYNRST